MQESPKTGVLQQLINETPVPAPQQQQHSYEDSVEITAIYQEPPHRQ